MTALVPYEEMCALLREGARIDDTPGARAAIHVLTFTTIPAGLVFQQRYVTVEERYSDVVRDMQPGAWVYDWAALARRGHGLRLTSTEQRMLRIAAAMHAGSRIDLPKALVPSLGWAHAKVIAEAVFIMTGNELLLVVAGTGELDELRAEYARLSGDGHDG